MNGKGTNPGRGVEKKKKRKKRKHFFKRGTQKGR